MYAVRVGHSNPIETEFFSMAKVAIDGLYKNFDPAGNFSPLNMYPKQENGQYNLTFYIKRGSDLAKMRMALKAFTKYCDLEIEQTETCVKNGDI